MQKFGGSRPRSRRAGLNRVVFPRRQPELHAGQVAADGDDVLQVLQILDIAGIMPAEMGSPEPAINAKRLGLGFFVMFGSRILRGS
jgi:hypothetical protein